jgi:predicted lipid-binding transport protein (Tim44 family)
MKRGTFLINAIVAITLAVSPGIAFARAGNSTSMGSRGSMTYSAPPTTRTAPNTAQPMQRSMTQPTAPSNAPSPGFGAQPMQPRSSFMSGLMGGLIGAGIGGLLFGHGMFGHGLGFGGFLGLLIQIAIVAWIVRLLFRMFAGSRQPVPASGPNMFARTGAPGPMAGGGGGGGPPPIEIGPGDYQQFEQLLQGVQAAWSAQDLNGLQAMSTPEMVSYFNEQLSEQASRGVRNSVTDVRLESGDLAQAWSEGGREYATVAMRFSTIDITRDNAGRVVDGNPNQRTTATEVWTFVRARGGHWILSAIQQTG